MSESGLLVIAVLGLLLATVMAGIAWRMRRAEQERSAARVSTLAADIRDAERFRAPAVVGLRQEPRVQPIAARKLDIDAIDRRFARPVEASIELLPGRSHESRLVPVLAIGLFAVVVALALILGTNRGLRFAAESASPAPAVHALSAPPPVELVLLDAKRDGDRLTVSGTVRNPQAGEHVQRLTAVVSYFSRDGKMLGSGSAPVQPSMAPGAESSFVVTIVRGRDVGRYRVRFHADERIVAHVDRRGVNPAPDAR